MKKIILFPILVAILLTSCLIGKRYARPAIEIPAAYLNHSDAKTKSDSIINVKWFQLFKDTVLNNIIAKALESNTDLKIAAIRIDQSRSQYRISKASLLPSVGYSASAQLSDPETDKFSLMGTASWELDFWGKLRHAKRAAYAEYLASEEAFKVLKTNIVSDAAILYFELRDLDNRLTVSKQTLESRTSYYHIVNERFIKGEVAELDKLQAEQQLAIIEATISDLVGQLNNTERSLNVLLGQNPQTIPRGVQNRNQTLPPEIPEGLPSTLLEQRPDVRSAENTLIAETEKIGGTQALRFPSFQLTGLLGIASTDLSNLLSDGTHVRNLTGSILGPLFEFGKNARRVEIQKGEAEIAVNKYLNTYRTALSEVENALVSVRTSQEEYGARRRQTEAARKVLLLTKAKYDSGYSNYLDVLVSETYAFDAEMQLSVTKAKQLEQIVSLYRALGGGW